MEVSQINWVFVLVAACASMALLAIFIMTFVVHYQKRIIQHEHEKQQEKLKFQSELLRANLLVEERERSRISKNIHDEVGILLSLLKMNLTGLNRNEDIAESEKRKLHNLTELTDKIIFSTRSIAKDLQSPLLRDFGFVMALNDLCKQINESNEMSVQLITQEMELRFDENIELQLYRICQEVINNILKHGATQLVQINLSKNSDELVLLFEYSGNGITDKEHAHLLKTGNGNGLKNIVSRLQLLKAKQTLSRDNFHFSHLIQIPLLNEKE
jgi:signal transduction histidine kinase